MAVRGFWAGAVILVIQGGSSKYNLRFIKQYNPPKTGSYHECNQNLPGFP